VAGHAAAGKEKNTGIRSGHGFSWIRAIRAAFYPLFSKFVQRIRSALNRERRRANLELVAAEGPDNGALSSANLIVQCSARWEPFLMTKEIRRWRDSTRAIHAAIQARHRRAGGDAHRAVIQRSAFPVARK